MGAQVPLARLLLHRGRLLEPGGRWHLWLHDQPANRSLLHAGPQHYGRPRSRRFLRSLWYARPGSHVDVSARTAGRPRVEGRFAELLLLGDERRPDGNDSTESAARRFAADRGFSQTWLLVFAQRRVPWPRSHADPPLDADTRGHAVRNRRDRLCGLYLRPGLRLLSERGVSGRSCPLGSEGNQITLNWNERGRMSQLEPERFQFTNADGLSITCVKMERSRGVVQIADGLGEHMGRYV